MKLLVSVVPSMILMSEFIRRKVWMVLWRSCLLTRLGLALDEGGLDADFFGEVSLPRSQSSRVYDALGEGTTS
jgi:hypothetical protein